MKKWPYVALGAALAATLVPFKVKKEENGDYELCALLYRVRKTFNAETGKDDYVLAFGCGCPKKKEPLEEDFVEDEDVIVIDETAEAPAEAAEEKPEEEPAPAEEAAPAEETAEVTE